VDHALTIAGLSKRFGDTAALSSVSLTVPTGEVMGLIGPNGAGKTTLCKILATLMPPDEGTVTMYGCDLQRDRHDIRRLIGYMPDQFGLFENLTVAEYLDFFAAAYRLPVNRREQVIGDISELTGLGAKLNVSTRGLSRGVQQRLCLARALIHDPRLLILDEPAANLDPHARVELREIIRTLAGMGKTVLISSHILTELADICGSVAIIEQGKLVAAGRVDELLARLQPHCRIRIVPAADPERCGAALAAIPHVTDVRADGGTLRALWTGPATEVNTVVGTLVNAGFAVAEFAIEESDLEDAFMALTAGNVQ